MGVHLLQYVPQIGSGLQTQSIGYKLTENTAVTVFYL